MKCFNNVDRQEILSLLDLLNIRVATAQEKQVEPGIWIFIFPEIEDTTYLPETIIDMSHFAYACKMRCPLNLVLENS